MHMINGTFEKSRVYFKAVSAAVPKWPYTVIFNHLTKPILIKVDPLFLIWFSFKDQTWVKFKDTNKCNGTKNMVHLTSYRTMNYPYTDCIQ